MPSKVTNAGGRSLPKFGEWDVNNPQSAEGFTLIFNTARDQKKNDKGNVGAPTTGVNQSPSQNNQGKQNQKPKQNHNDQRHASKNKWLCCLSGK